MLERHVKQKKEGAWRNQQKTVNLPCCSNLLGVLHEILLLVGAALNVRTTEIIYTLLLHLFGFFCGKLIDRRFRMEIRYAVGIVR